MSQWLIVLGMGAVTVAIRLSFLVLVDHGSLPRPARAALRFVSPAVLMAILVPAVFFMGTRDEFTVGADNERLPAALAAGAIAWVTRSVWLTIGVGMAVLWLAKALT